MAERDVVLTGDQMWLIEQEIGRSQLPGQDGTIFVLKMLHGQDCFEQEQKLDPRTIAIPEHQWKQICQWILDRDKKLHPSSPSPSPGLTWMNWGPSAFEPEPSRG